MLAAVAVAAVLPVLGVRRFFFWDDTAAAFVPQGRRIGDLVSGGELPWLDLSLWRGGNIIGEAAYGIWNPIVLLADVTILQLDDLELASALLKGLVMVLLAGGVYLLARDYGAPPWPAAVVGAAVPFSGFSLWMDAASWAVLHLTFAITPWVWLAARWLARGRCGPVWFVLAGFACVSAGNPYSNAIVLFVVLAVGVEHVLTGGERRRLALLFGGLVAIALTAVLVYLPFQLSSTVGYRTTSTFNDEFLAPGLTDLLNLSTPSLTPYVTMFGLPRMTFPGAYLAWFVLPLAPWLEWRRWSVGWRGRVGLLVFGAILLALTLGPSNLWFFRWPARLIPYLFLPVAIAFAVTLGFGVRTTSPLRRSVASAAIVGAGAYLAWADVPQHLGWHVLGVLVVGALTAATVAAAGPGRRGAVLMIGTVGVLALQLQWMPTNANVADYHFPASASTIADDLAGRYRGTTIQIASIGAVPAGELHPDGVYRDLMFGSMYAVAGVESTTAYSGLGFSPLDGALCLQYQGGTCPEAWDALWRPAPGSDQLLADLLGAETVVVQKTLIDTAALAAPDGWAISDETDNVVVWQRLGQLPWPDGRLSNASGPLDVVSDRLDGARREIVEVRAPAGEDAVEPTTLTFARLAWPGYRATIDGRSLPVRSGPAGLVSVDVPAGSEGTVELWWRPPGLRLGLAAAVGAIVLTVALQVLSRRRRRDAPDIGPPSVAEDQAMSPPVAVGG